MVGNVLQVNDSHHAWALFLLVLHNCCFVQGADVPNLLVARPGAGRRTSVEGLRVPVSLRNGVMLSDVLWEPCLSSQVRLVTQVLQKGHGVYPLAESGGICGVKALGVGPQRAEVM